MVIKYIENLSRGRAVLWCYLLWYLVTVAYYFDPAPAIWLNSLGISAIIGLALMLSVSGSGSGSGTGAFWQNFRLFMMPFCVSSFSALIKGKGYVLVFPPDLEVLAVAVGACISFLVLVYIIKFFGSKSRQE